PRRAARAAVGERAQPLEETRRKHRPQDERRWSEIVLGDPEGEPERERREEGARHAGPAPARGRERRKEPPVGPDPTRERLGCDPGRRLARPEDDPERLATTELDEDRLA